jgi:hypothetical protein
MTHFKPTSGNPAEPQWVSDRTKIKVSIALALSVCITIVASTWAARGYLEGWKGDLADHFQKVEASQTKIASDLAATRASLTYKWSESQMVIWAAALDKQNRTVKRAEPETGLQVPDPTSIRREP